MRRAVVFLLLIYLGPARPQLDNPLQERSVQYMLETAIDLIQHTNVEVWRIDIMRQSYRGSAPYEIGFLIRTTEERYRKMVDLYNSSVTMDTTAVRTRDHVLFLQKIEKLHWDITHLANMLHEVERKYKIVPQVMNTREFYPFGKKPDTTATTKLARAMRTRRRHTRGRRRMFMP